MAHTFLRDWLPDTGVLQFETALADVLGSSDTLDVASDLTVRPYVASKLSLVSKEHTVVPLESLLVGESLGMAVNTNIYV